MSQILRLATFFNVILFLSACNSIMPAPTATPLPLATATPSPAITLTPTAVPSPTITLTPTTVHSPTVTPSSMASLVPILTSTPMPTRTSSPTATPTTPSATPAVKGIYDGNWNGTTSQGKTIKFKIENDTITLFAIEFEPKVCGVSAFTNLEAQTLKGNTFDKVIKFGVTTWFVVSGVIDAQGKMSGTLIAEKTLLCEPTRLEWSATR